MTLESLSEVRPPFTLTHREQTTYLRDGFYIAKDITTKDHRERYEQDYEANGPYGTGTAYMQSEPMRDLLLAPPLMRLLNALVGEPVGLHLVLTGWTSTERDWHQDDYLNPPFIDGRYAAVWIPLEEITPDSGPFEVVVGSNAWPVVRRELLLEALGEDGSDPDWPYRSEALLTPLYEAQIQRTDSLVMRYLGKPGEVLVWSGRTVHRGSKPDRPGASRRALIAHYSALDARADMPVRRQHGDDPASVYFVL